MSARGNTGRPRGSRDLRGRATRPVSLRTLERASREITGRAIRRARLEAGVAASELAAACGVTASAVHAWEAGSTSIRYARLWQVAVALGVSVESLTR